MEDVLNVKNIHFSYHETSVINDVSFDIKENEFTGMIGPNGSGKSTLIKIISRYLKINSGFVNYRGKNINDYSGRELSKKISVLPQSLKPVFEMRVYDFVLLGRLPFKSKFEKFNDVDVEETEKSLKITGSFNLKDRTIMELSGGEWQRILLSQALCQTPDLLLLDEPTTHLDIGHQIEVMDILYELNAGHKITIIMIVHDLNIAGEYCGKILFLDNGILKYSGTPAEVLNYSAIEDIYKVKALVYTNPTTGKPNVFPVPGRYVK
jgi:iron complex transport system ATP-binding protein